MIISVTVNAVYCHRREGVKSTSPDTANHEQNGYVKVYDDNNILMTNVDNDNSDATYTDKHKHNMREV